MDTEITGSHEEQGIGVEVYDENGNRHWIVVMWDGSIDGHETDDYPLEPEDRTFEQQKLITQVEQRAKLAAQREFPDADILSIEWLPEGVERGIEALQTMHVDEFAEQFETCYGMVTAPERFEDVTEETAQIIHQPFFIDDSNDVVYVPTPIIQYRNDGEVKTTHRESGISQAPGEKLTIMLPPLEFHDGDYEFPDGFQVFLIEHLQAQIRDIYRHVGEKPPEPYADIDEEMPGIGLTAADREFYDGF